MSRQPSDIARARLGSGLARADARDAPRAAPSDPSVRVPGYDVVCYDCETTGLSYDYVQVLQFAALLADESFEVVRTRDLRISLMPYVVPSPGALRVTKVDFAGLDDPDRHDEYDAAHAISSMLAPEGGRARLYLTFNGIRYDDECLRRMFFRNLLDPYFGKAPSRRIDLLNLARLVAAHPGSPLRIPRADELEEGKGRYQLTSICEANGIGLGVAHDALYDARATMELASHIRATAPWAWNVAFATGNNHERQARVREAAERRGALWLFDPYCKNTPKFDRPGDLVPCAVFELPGNRFLAVDLTLVGADDLPDPLPDPETFAFGGAACRDGDGYDTRPFRSFTSSRIDYMLTGAEAAAAGFFDAMTAQTLDDAAASFHARTDEIHRLVRHASRRTAWPARPGSETKIYDGFPSDRDKDRAVAYAAAMDWDERLDIQFSDPRLRDFAARLALRLAPPGRLEAKGEAFVDSLRADAAEALGRPHARPDEDMRSPWDTVRSCLSEPKPPDGYRDWLVERYGAPGDGPENGAEDGPGEDAHFAPGPR